jgi:hypothetical protein
VVKGEKSWRARDLEYEKMSRVFATTETVYCQHVKSKKRKSLLETAVTLIASLRKQTTRQC